MKIVVYACIPVEPDSRLFRRVRIAIDNTKVKSMELSCIGDEHHSCNHKCTVHQYLASREVEQLYDQYADRLHNPRVGGFPSHPGS